VPPAPPSNVPLCLSSPSNPAPFSYKIPKPLFPSVVEAPPAAPIPLMSIIGAVEDVSVTAPCDFRTTIVPFVFGLEKVNEPVPVIEIDV
jgi:hypothetical protein